MEEVLLLLDNIGKHGKEVAAGEVKSLAAEIEMDGIDRFWTQQLLQVLLTNFLNNLIGK